MSEAITRSDALAAELRRLPAILLACARAGEPHKLDSVQIGASRQDCTVHHTLGGASEDLHCWVVCAAEPRPAPGALIIRASLVVGVRQHHPIRAGQRMLAIIPPRQEYGVFIHRGPDYHGIEIGPGRVDLYGWAFDWNDFLACGGGL